MTRRSRRDLPEPSVTVRRTRRGPVYVRISSLDRTQGRPFLLIPGMGVSATYFERLAAHLSAYGPVHSLDLPGFGGVPHPRNGLTIAEFADLVAAAIDDLALADPVLIGHSMGTQIAVDLAARRPDLSTLVLIGPVVNAAERTVERQALRFLQTARRERLRVKVIAVSAYLLCGLRWFTRVLPEMMQYRLEDQLPHITANTLVLHGEWDRNCPPDWAHTVAHLLPHAEIWQVPNAAHSVIVAHAAEIAEICARHARPRPARQPAQFGLHPPMTPQATEPPTVRKLLTFARGRGTELLGILLANDALIARGKSQNAHLLLNARHTHG